MPITDMQQAEIVTLLAKGHSQVEVAKMLGLAPATVNKHANVNQQVKDHIALKRMELRKKISDRLEKSIDGIIDRMENASEDETVEPKGLELITRALGNLEKVSASVSGDNKKSEAVPTGPVKIIFQGGWGNQTPPIPTQTFALPAAEDAEFSEVTEGEGGGS